MKKAKYIKIKFLMKGPNVPRNFQHMPKYFRNIIRKKNPIAYDSYYGILENNDQNKIGQNSFQGSMIIRCAKNEVFH